MDTISVSIHILKPTVVQTPQGEEVRGEWRLNNFQNHDNGHIYMPEENKVLTKKIIDIINRDLKINAEELYYEAVRTL